jgi:hypothetical protein
MEDTPSTELTPSDIDKFSDFLFKHVPIYPKCNWCNKSYFIREVGPNYICYDCEIEERKIVKKED